MHDECRSLKDEKDQLQESRSALILRKGQLAHNWFFAAAEERARIQIEIDQIGEGVLQREDRLDRIAERLQELDCEQVAASISPLAADPSYLYDVFVSFCDEDPDLGWVWEELIPRLEERGIRYAVAADAPAGAPRLPSIERLFQNSRRAIAVLTEGYLTRNALQFESILIQDESIRADAARLIPIFLETIDAERPPAWLPSRLQLLNSITFSLESVRRGRRIARLDPWERLMQTLQSPLTPLLR